MAQLLCSLIVLMIIRNETISKSVLLEKTGGNGRGGVDDFSEKIITFFITLDR